MNSFNIDQQSLCLGKASEGQSCSPSHTHSTFESGALSQGNELTATGSFTNSDRAESMGWVCAPVLSSIQRDIDIVNQVQAWGVPNVFGARIKLDSCWNFELMQQLVTSTCDREVVEFLKYGWPVNYNGSHPPITWANHGGALRYKQHISEYIFKELKYGALVGPLCSLPWKERVAVSPMTTRPKKDSIKRQVITDLSWGECGGVNGGIPDNSYLDSPMVLLYPSVDSICFRAFQLGPGRALGYKKDIARAFRWINLCPRDWPLMGTSWEGALYFDKVAVMGCRTCPYMMQRVSGLYRHWMADLGYTLFNYVDDFMGLEERSKAWQAYTTLGNLIRDTGLTEAQDKAVEPSSNLVCLGTGFNLVNMIIYVPQGKLEEIKVELGPWFSKTWCTRHQMECLIGKLQYDSSCVRPGRVFISRLLNFLRATKPGQRYLVTQSIIKDISWWWKYLTIWNGQSIMWLHSDNQMTFVIATDGCLSGVGAVFQNRCFRRKIPDRFMGDPWHITHIEMLGLLVSLQLWGERLSGHDIKLLCDNEAVVCVVYSLFSRDSGLQAMLRKLCFLQAKFDLRIKMQHLTSSQNYVADVLSRSHLSLRDNKKCDIMIQERQLIEEQVPEFYFRIEDHW